MAQIKISERSTKIVRLLAETWLTSDGDIVGVGDVRADRFVGPAGREFSWDEAISIGVIAPTVGPTTKEAAEADEGDEGDLADLLTAAELRGIVKGRGIAIGARANKATAIQKLRRGAYA